MEEQWDTKLFLSAQEKYSHCSLGNIDTVKFVMDKRQWKKYLRAEDEQVIDELRLKPQRGLVIGNQGFVKGLERKLKRSLECFNPGRPKQESC